jgi:hypothetical protein
MPPPLAEVDLGPAAAPGPDLQTGRVTFPELVLAHFHWRAALDAHPAPGAPQVTALERRFRSALARFEEVEGEIVSVYWCVNVESATALTIPTSPSRLPWRTRAAARFHRVSDWATRDAPAVARLMHECDELAIRTTETLGPKGQRVCMQLVAASASHLLSLVDVADPAGAAVNAEAIATERAELQAARTYYREAANSDAQMVYFGGMGAGTVALLGLAVLVGGWVGAGGIDVRTFFGALSSGALGALVSVIARINDGTFALDYDVSRRYSLFLGALRPVIGAIFGMAVYLAISSGLLDVFKVPTADADHFAFLCVVAFIAGFSERWAQDTLTSVAPAARTPGEAPAEHLPAGPSDRDE